MENNLDLDILDKKLNSKKLLSLNIFNINNNNQEPINNAVNFNINNNTDSPSNKIFSMKILTFGQNCNFPSENIEEFDDEEMEDLGINIKNKSEKNRIKKIMNLNELHNKDLKLINKKIVINSKDEILKNKNVDKQINKNNNEKINKNNNILANSNGSIMDIMLSGVKHRGKYKFADFKGFIKRFE